MTVTIIRTQADRIRSTTMTTLRGLKLLHKTDVVSFDNLKEIKIISGYKYVPDFDLIWSEDQQHYRVYICLGDINTEKTRAPLNVFVIGSGIAASMFVTVYTLFSKYRGKNQNAVLS